MSSWLRSGQPQPLGGRDPRKSATFNGFIAMQSQCQEQMARLFEAVNAPENQGGEIAFQRAVQRKNECFARAVCPEALGAAWDCVMGDPQRAGAGQCDAELETASTCVTSFWQGALNPRVETGMQAYASCTDTCAIPLMKQKECLGREGLARAPVHCARERALAEQCLGGCLQPDLQIEFEKCQENGEDCSRLQSKLAMVRSQAGRSVLREMGFRESEVAGDAAEQLMDVVSMLIFTSVLENRDDLRRQ